MEVIVTCPNYTRAMYYQRKTLELIYKDHPECFLMIKSIRNDGWPRIYFDKTCVIFVSTASEKTFGQFMTGRHKYKLIPFYKYEDIILRRVEDDSRTDAKTCNVSI